MWLLSFLKSLDVYIHMYNNNNPSKFYFFFFTFIFNYEMNMCHLACWRICNNYIIYTWSIFHQIISFNYVYTDCEDLQKLQITRLLKIHLNFPVTQSFCNQDFYAFIENLKTQITRICKTFREEYLTNKKYNVTYNNK